MMKMLLVAEIDAEDRPEAEQALDAFREVAPTREHGLTLYQATGEDARSIPPRFEDEPAASDDQQYCIIADESSHYYLCPVELAEDVREYFVATSRYWQQGADREESSPPEEPDGFERVERIDGYSNVHFENPEVI